MKWLEERQQFQQRFDKLSQENIQYIITELNKVTAQYINKGGLSQDPNNNPDYNKIIQLTNRAESIKKSYIQLNDDITKLLTENAKDTDISGLLAENGEMQKHINRLEKLQDEMKVDVESAVERDKLLRSRNTDVSSHKLFILDRPVRKGLIPYLWVLSILFIGIGLVIFKMTAPTIVGQDPTALLLIIGFLTDKRILVSLLVAALIVIIFLAMKVAGVFGK
jgi:hypothetical protein